LVGARQKKCRAALTCDAGKRNFDMNELAPGLQGRNSGKIISFPARGPFTVQVAREDQAWLVVCRSHGWLHGSRREALAVASAIASGFGVAVVVNA
jgi:hypothetical protein